MTVMSSLSQRTHVRDRTHGRGAVMAALEQRCLEQAASLHQARQQHEEVVGHMRQQHAAQVRASWETMWGWR